MKNFKIGLIAVVVIVAGILLSDSFFTVRQYEQAMVFQFGDHRRTIQNDPGLHVKLPFVQNVVVYESRVLTIDPPVEQVILADQRRLNVDTFAIYRIVDPLLFYQAVSTYDVARQRVSTFINAALRAVLGNRLQIEVLSGERAGIMEDIQRRVSRNSEPLGIEIVDVRIGRADVPDSTLRSVYDRMRSEREREAREYRARGEEEAQQIRARADREVSVLLAQAERQAQILRGQGDSQAIAILAEAHSLDPVFFSFYRSLQAYRTSMGDERTTLVMAPTGDFFRYFQDIAGGNGDLLANARDPDDLMNDIRRLLVPADGEEADTLGLGPGGSPQLGTPPGADDAGLPVIEPGLPDAEGTPLLTPPEGASGLPGAGDGASGLGPVPTLDQPMSPEADGEADGGAPASASPASGAASGAAQPPAGATSGSGSAAEEAAGDAGSGSAPQGQDGQ
jgi:membrane protease subunit HflC